MKQSRWNDYREISLTQLSLAVINKWKILVLFAAVGALIGALYGAGVYLRSKDAIEEKKNSYENKRTQYEELIELYKHVVEREKGVLLNNQYKEVKDYTDRLSSACDEAYLLDCLTNHIEKMDSIERPQPPDVSYSISTGISIVAKKMVMLCVIFFVFAFVFLSMKILYTGTFLSGEEMRTRYDLREIGYLTNDNKSMLKNGVDNRYLCMTQMDQNELVAMTLSKKCAELKELVVVSTLNNREIESAISRIETKSIHLNILIADSIISNIRSREMLSENVCVVVLEKVLKSTYKDMDREIRLLEEWNAKVIGLVVVY